MKVFFGFILLACLCFSCGGDGPAKLNNQPSASTPAPAKEDDGKGVGEIKQVVINNPLRSDMVDRGKGIYEMKCSACHKLSDQRVVGPGWKGVTERRKPEWIMNMVTNVEVMLDKDPAAQKLLEECLTRMPNQNISIGDSRDLLEFMYANDGGVVGK